MTAPLIRLEPEPSKLCAPPPRRPIGAAELPSLAQAFLLFGLEGMCSGFGMWLLRAGDLVAPYLLRNQIAAEGRTFVLADMVGGALLFCIAATAFLVWRRKAAVPLLLRTAWILSPLIPLSMLPMMFDWRLWREHELTFLVIAATIVLGVRAFVGQALDQDLRTLLPARLRAAMGSLSGVVLPARLRRALPVGFVGLLVALYTVFFSWRTIEYHWNLRTSAFDLALEENLVWNALHGTPVLFKSAPFAGPSGTHFGNHATFFAYVLAPFYAIYQHPETLLVIQAALIGGAAIPLFLFARRYIGHWPAALVAAFYLLNPAVHGTNLYDYHYLPLGPFFIWLTLYALEARRNVLTVIAIVLTLSVREDVAGGLAIVGAYLLFTGRRPVAGVVVAMIGLGYLVLMKMVIMPMAAHGSESFVGIYSGMLPSGDSSFGGVLKTAIANPAFTIANLLEAKKLVFFLQIVVPLAFLPLRRSIGFLCALPGLLFTLLSTGYAPVIELGFQYPAHWTSFFFIALVANLQWMAEPRHPADQAGPSRKKAWLAALAAGTLVVSYQFGVVFQSDIARAGFGSARFGTTDSDRQLRQELNELIALVPPRAKVVGSEKLLPQVANRPDAYTLRVGLFDAEYMLLDLRGFTAEEKTNARKAFTDEKFGVVEVRGNFVLAKRGFESDKTAAILPRVR